MFLEAVEKSFRKRFTNGFFRASDGVLGNGTFFISFGLIRELHKIPHSIRENDCLRLTLGFHDAVNDDGSLQLKICGESNTSYLSGLKPIHKHYAQSSIKLGYRKATLTPEKMIKKLDTFFDKCAQLVIDNRENMLVPFDDIYLPTVSK